MLVWVWRIQLFVVDNVTFFHLISKVWNQTRNKLDMVSLLITDHPSVNFTNMNSRLDADTDIYVLAVQPFCPVRQNHRNALDIIEEKKIQPLFVFIYKYLVNKQNQNYMPWPISRNVSAQGKMTYFQMWISQMVQNRLIYYHCLVKAYGILLLPWQCWSVFLCT